MDVITKQRLTLSYFKWLTISKYSYSHLIKLSQESNDLTIRQSHSFLVFLNAFCMTAKAKFQFQCLKHLCKILVHSGRLFPCESLINLHLWTLARCTKLNISNYSFTYIDRQRLAALIWYIDFGKIFVHCYFTVIKRRTEGFLLDYVRWRQKCNCNVCQ